MGVQYFCKHKRRRQTVREHPTLTLNGIDYLEVLDRDAELLASPRQRTLLLRCIRPLSTTVTAENVEISGGVRITPVDVEWAARASDAGDLFGQGLISEDERDYFLGLEDPDHVLVVRTNSEGDYSTYLLCLVTDHAPITGFDPPLTIVEFSFKVECPSEFDCQAEDACPPEAKTPPPLDYLAKDYASFRRLMLDRLSVVMPDWKDGLPADLGVALVEVMAYAGDYLSYYQDAAATEAYLGQARRRPSIRRHARLLDYAMHDGTNARAWVALRVESGVQNALLQREYAADGRTRLLTRVPSQGTVVAPEDFKAIVAEHRPQVFELLFDQRLYDVHNDISFYTWGDEECCLPKGATRATLKDYATHRLLLRPGDVLVFEEVLGPDTGAEADADPVHRHAVRLTHVDPPAAVDEDGMRSPGPLKTDELYEEQPIVEIGWTVEDALPFPLCLSTGVQVGGEEVYYEDVSMAHGNVVLADQGRTLAGEDLPTPTGHRGYRPPLKEADVTQRVPFDEAAWAVVDPSGNPVLGAASALNQDLRKALPAVELASDEGETWRPQRDLLASDRFDAHFVVEMENDGRSALRFGDNIYGKRPEGGMDLSATYRIGGGVVGNVGAKSIAHIVTAPGLGIVSEGDKPGVRNPLPATGGVAPESIEEVRQYAPQAFRRQERAVTEADYAEVSQRHPEVSKAVGRRRWTGSWHTMFITVDRLGGRPVDQDFEEELSAFLERFQLAGHDVEIEPPRFVPLDLALSVCVEPGYLASDVKQVLFQEFSSRDLPDGRRGYFHPDNFTFGQPVYLSRIVARAMEVSGVRWVRIDPDTDPPGRFQRWGEKPRTEVTDGYVDIGRFEIAQLDNDANAPENGKIEFHMEGGL
jgi:hypothetical protein